MCVLPVVATGSVSGVTSPTGGLLMRFLLLCSYFSMGRLLGLPSFPRPRAIWALPLCHHAIQKQTGFYYLEESNTSEDEVRSL